MNALGCGLLLTIVGLPVAWVVSEFRSSRPVRIVLGLVSMAVIAASVSGVFHFLTIIQYNSDFGFATKELVEASIGQIEDGHLDRVLKAWRGLNAQYQPTYENRAHYPELAAQATALIRGETPTPAGTPWDAQPFDVKTWVGHWEDDAGFWLVIQSNGNLAMDVWRSGNPPERMQTAELSPDFRMLTMREGDEWRHTLTLDDKYELTHEWFDLARKRVWRTEPMYKLIRATEDQKRQTQVRPKRE